MPRLGIPTGPVESSAGSTKKSGSPNFGSNGETGNEQRKSPPQNQPAPSADSTGASQDHHGTKFGPFLQGRRFGKCGHYRGSFPAALHPVRDPPMKCLRCACDKKDGTLIRTGAWVCMQCLNELVDERLPARLKALQEYKAESQSTGDQPGLSTLPLPLQELGQIPSGPQRED